MGAQAHAVGPGMGARSNGLSGLALFVRAQNVHSTVYLRKRNDQYHPVLSTNRGRTDAWSCIVAAMPGKFDDVATREDFILRQICA
jgi:hypothetical protein